MGPRREEPDRHAPTGAGLLRARPAERLGDLLDVTDEVGIERLAARA